MPSCKWMLSALILVAAGVVITRSQADDAPARTVQIGMVQSLFVDIPRPLVNVLALPFANLMKEQTGVDGQLVIAGDAFHVGKLLHEDKYQVGIFQGIEFAWARTKYADLQPLMIAVGKHQTLRATLVANQENTAGGFVAFQGKELAIPQRSKVHVRLFLEHGCNDGGHCEPQAFFGKINRPTSPLDALDEVCFGTLPAAVVDSVDLEFYKEIKPGCHKRLRVVQQSEPFPTGVIAVHKNALDQQTLDSFRNGMLNAHSNVRAREMMALFQLTAFEPVPENFEQTVTNILRTYPAPEPHSAKTNTSTSTKQTNDR
jgi:ABC-type phosphate/phosphonate transport system substrate-binding protein